MVKKTITEIAQEAIAEYPGWAIKCGYLLELGKKYQVNSNDIFKEMVRLSN